MTTLEHLIQYFLNIDKFILSSVISYGLWVYAALFLIVFCETGIIIASFLPGDSLLFTAGSIAASSSQPLSLQLLFVSLTIASIIGNKLNYFIGRSLGARILKSENPWLLKKKHIEDAHQFYKKHGGKTIILARFLPIIRTFAPFIAGASAMNMRQFSIYNALSAILWVGGLLSAGYFLGQLPFVQENFSMVIYGIIVLTLLPLLLHAVCAKYSIKKNRNLN